MLQDWLRRFRLSGVPGAPATAGVPRDKTSSLEDELRPLLAQLGDAERRTRAIEERFDTGTRRLLDDAKTGAEKLIADARVQAGCGARPGDRRTNRGCGAGAGGPAARRRGGSGTCAGTKCAGARRTGRQGRRACSRRRGASAVSASWVAAAVRARGLVHRRLGPDAIRELESASALGDAIAALADSPYGRYVRRGMALEQAERAVERDGPVAPASPGRLGAGAQRHEPSPAGGAVRDREHRGPSAAILGRPD